MSTPSPSTMEKEALPSKRLSTQGSTLLGFERRFAKVSSQLRLLMHLSDLQKWSNKFHGGQTKICAHVAEQYPLVVFHGDVGTGKTVTAESIANRLVLEDEKADDSILFKLTTSARGSGKVGEMGTLINQAFHDVIKSAGDRRRAFLIIDEGDSFAAKRTQEHNHHEDKVAVNTLIQNINELCKYKGRILVFLCTNRLGVVDPAIFRRAAVMEEFVRPDDAERTDLFNLDLVDLKFSEQDIEQLVRATGFHKKRNVPWTYSDIRIRLYPAAVARAFPDRGLEMKDFLQAAQEMEPSPAMEEE